MRSTSGSSVAELNGARPALLSGWGRTAPTRAALHRPPDPEAVARLLRLRPPRGVLPRGLGRSYGDAAQNAGGNVLETTELSEVRLDPHRGLATVGAGVSIGALARELLPRGWFLPVVPGTREVTVGGAIAADVHGKNHHRDGSFCDHVESLELILPDGTTATVPGERADERLAATAGGMGLTGVVRAATIRLLRVETSRIRTDTERAPDLDDLMARMEEGDHRYRYSVAWVDCLAAGARLGRGVLQRGDHARADELDAADDPLALPASPALPPAPPLPIGAVRPAVMRAFNELWFRKAPARESGRLEPLEAFFWPLDRLRDWNRLYGQRGLLQYQFAAPADAGAVVRLAIERFAGSGWASLAVLKRFGPGAGMLSFPIEGWTLAVDAPAQAPGLAALLDDLDERVAKAGGRVYLAKDARLRPDLLGAMYPELARWRAARDRLDPDRVMRSDLERRLSLTGP